jgi:hypothetical protein
MTLPNFLIIGAAKSATSSLYRYLIQHPQVYGSIAKEPSFFAFEGEALEFSGPGDHIFNQAAITKLEAYEALFEGVSGEIAVGEASVVYLYSEKAPQRIKHYLPDAKFIVIRRNPVDRALSSFSHLLRDGFEPISDFSQALDAEEERITQNWQHLWHYKRMGFYHSQLRRYFDLFRPDQFAVFTYEEFSAEPLVVIKQIFRFLSVGDSFVPDMSHSLNVSGIPRSKSLHKFLMQRNFVKRSLKPLIPSSIRHLVQKTIVGLNMVEERVEITEATRGYLQNEYREDILQLEQLINRDLSDWLK